VKDQRIGTSPLTVAIIGTGLAVEKLHWPALKQMPDRFQVTAFSNHSRPNAEHFVAYIGTSAFIM
jgi:predicted dehydrogenase